MSKRPYPKKPDNERRVVVSFSLSDDRLEWFKEMLCLQIGAEPSIDLIRSVARDIAQQAIDEQIKRKVEIDNSAIII